MDQSNLQRVMDDFFAALDDRRLGACQELLDAAHKRLRGKRQRQWLSYLHAILHVEGSPPRWDRAERVLIDLLESELLPSLRGRVLLELGLNADWQGDCALAVEYHRRSLAMFEQCGDLSYQAKSLKNLGIAYTRAYELGQLGRDALARALTCHNRSLEICRSLGAEHLASTVQGALGAVHKALGQWEQALTYYLARAITCRRENDRYGLARMLNNLGEIYQRQQKTILAHRCYHRALALLSELHEQYETADVLANLASLQHDQDHIGDALSAYDDAISIVESIRTSLASETARAGFLSTQMHVYEGKLRLSLETGRIAGAFATLERSKSRSFIELLAGQSLRPPEGVPSEWLSQEQRLREKLEGLYRDSSPLNDETLFSLERDLDQLRRKIRLCDAEYVSFQVAEPLELEAVQARLPLDAVLLEYFTTNDTAGVFVVSRDDAAAIPLGATVPVLRRAYEAERQVIARIVPDRRGRLVPPWPLIELYQLLIEPIADRLRHARLLCIVPHGPLHTMPFHALCPEIRDSASPLFEICPVLYAPSATVLLDYCGRKQPSGQAHNLCLAYNGSATATQAPLRYAEQEGRAVAGLLGSKLVAGAVARKDLIQKEAHRYRFLHFACHGHFNPNFPLTSGLELADGTLDVRDVLDRVRLDADLVALSSCETGQSALRRGDELIGLVRAFMYAGTPSVLVSLWKVDDVSTGILMECFYRELLKGQTTKAEALQRAQRQLASCTETDVREWLTGHGVERPTVDGEIARLRQIAGIETAAHGDQLFSHPFYWAPFCLNGDRLLTAGTP